MTRGVVWVCAVVTAGAGLAGAVPGPPSAPTSDRSMTAGGGPVVGGYAPPLGGALEVVRRFDPPSTPYGPGHLGVDLRARASEEVRSAGPGVVRFAGSVAGRGVVVIAHPDGISTEYEPVQPSVRAGAHVRIGQPVGVLTGRHQGCPGSCLHWGARRGGHYLDPLALLRPLGPVVLLPWRPVS